jgi:hypothetical protein
MKNYTTANIAALLPSNQQNVNTYIRKGYLKAISVNGRYEITHEDYLSFREEYFDCNKRNSSKGVSKKLTPEQISLFDIMISDLKSREVSLQQFTDRYETKRDSLPLVDDFIVYKRDSSIRADKLTKKYTNNILAINYGMSVGSIQKIVSEGNR